MRTYFTDPETGIEQEVKFVEWSAVPGHQIWRVKETGRKIQVTDTMLRHDTTIP